MADGASEGPARERPGACHAAGHLAHGAQGLCGAAGDALTKAVGDVAAHLHHQARRAFDAEVVAERGHPCLGDLSRREKASGDQALSRPSIIMLPIARIHAGAPSHSLDRGPARHQPVRNR
jgi:hypothetical protein